MRKIYPVIIGLGYVGLPIFLNLQKHFKTIGYDTNIKRVISLKKRKDFNQEFKSSSLQLKKKSALTKNLDDIKNGNFFIVCVPTPVDKKNIPDLSLLKKSCIDLSKILKKGDIIFFESTVYPTVTNNICIPLLNNSGLKENKDFYVGYSPERINPGDNKKDLNSISKIVAFRNNKIKSQVKNVYSKISKKIFFSKNIVEAETSKVIENIQRDLNIGLINEIYKVCEKANINFKNVINLAKTKWNFVTYQPGLVGGHCLPVDPYYFSYFAKNIGIKTNILLSGRKTNNVMVNFVTKKILIKLNKIKNIKNKKILILGLTYKKNVADIRNSLAIKVFRNLKKKYKNIRTYDPYLDNRFFKKLKLIKTTEIKKQDIFIILNNHDKFNKLRYLLLKKILINPFV